MYALVDANSFYASAEEVFDPSIRGKPIVVLTNNDGCICAMSSAAKLTGIKGFVPYHTVKHQLRAVNAVIRSSNYALYADLSKRVFEITGRFANQHVYSVDEVFLHFRRLTLTANDWVDIAKDIRQTVWRETRIPVGVGLGPTPTLAKVASYAGKRVSGFSGIAVLDTLAKQQHILEQMRVEQIWGVGKRIALRLNEMGVYSGWDLAQQSAKGIRAKFSVEMERTVRELNGEVCFSWNTLKQPKQQIFASRSFGQDVSSMGPLQESVALHAQRVGRKLRMQNSLAAGLQVFVKSNPHKDNYYTASHYHQFISPTSDDRELVNAAVGGITKIYRPGVFFQKSGVGATDIVDCNAVQSDFFADEPVKKPLMPCIDAINAKFGNKAVMIAREGTDKSQWQMRRNYLSPQFTTKWSDIPVFNC